MEYSEIKIEILSIKKHNSKEILKVVKAMHDLNIDTEIGLVDCVNMYNRKVTKAPLYGESPRGLIFKSFNN